MEKNPFENDLKGASGGHREFGDLPRPNLEALKAKRDEYLAKAINDVMKEYDQKKINLIVKSIDNIDSDEKARFLLEDLTFNIKTRLTKEHHIDPFDVSPSGSLDVQEKRIVDSFMELEATYPEDMIKDRIIATLKTEHI